MLSATELEEFESYAGDILKNRDFKKLAAIPGSYAIKKFLNKSVGGTKQEHSVRTGILCCRFAKKLGVDKKLAARSGMLHDIGLARPGCRLCRNSEYYNCGWCHSKVSARIATELHEDSAVINAIRVHMFPAYPTRPPLKPLELLLWFCDRLDVIIFMLGLSNRFFAEDLKYIMGKKQNARKIPQRV